MREADEAARPDRALFGLVGRRWAVLAASTLAFAGALGFVRFGYSLVLPAMQAGLGLAAADMGFIAGWSFAAYLACSLPAGALATRLGMRRTIVGGLLAAAVGLALTALSRGIALATIGQVIAGGAIAAVIVPVLAISTGWFPPRFWSLATGVVVAGGGIGFLVSGFVVPRLVVMDPAGGWRLAWFGMAAVVLAVAAVVAWLVRDPPRTVRRPPLLASLRQVYTSGAVWQLGGVFLLYGVAYITYGTFFTAHLVGGHGLDPILVGQLWALNGAAGIVGAPLVGAVADRLGHRPTLVLLFALQGTSLLLLALATDPGWFAVSAIFYGFTVWCFAGVISAAAGAVVGPALAPAGVGLAVVLMSVGQMIGPIVGGLLAEPSGSFTRSLLVGAGVDALGLLGTLAMRMSAPRRTTAAAPAPDSATA
ncbi:MAG: YbfB/YjiJ family MFS transporter [Chloroflexota bacterium]|nr:YbfB/YjiJ family MFS transporter [Chloroflexota bacterium]